MEFTINRQLVWGTVERTGNSLFLRLVLSDWDWLNVRKGWTVALVTDEHEGSYLIVDAIRLPAGEPEAWLFLRPVGPLPKDHPPANEMRGVGLADVAKEKTNLITYNL